eukprot:1140695-Pelagomonas_calceolata.AAC.4
MFALPLQPEQSERQKRGNPGPNTQRQQRQGQTCHQGKHQDMLRAHCKQSCVLQVAWPSYLLPSSGGEAPFELLSRHPLPSFTHPTPWWFPFCQPSVICTPTAL